MNMATWAVLSALVLSASSLAAPTSQSVRHMRSECAKGRADKFVIKEYENKMVSVCPSHGNGDCQYTVTSGKTFLDSRLHLNSDRLSDYVIKDLSTGYGNNYVAHFMLFAQCHDGNFVQVADDFVTTVKPDVMDASTGWLKLRVTRDCYSESIGDTQERSYTIAYHPKRSKYGAPDDNPALANYCSDTELAVPLNSSGVS